MTGGDVVVDAAHPAATPTVVGNEHDIPTGTDNRDVTENHLTVDGVSVGGSYVYNGRAYGGLTQADAGNATKNTVMVKNNARVNGAVYGGWSKNGDATYNTVILNKTGLSSSYWNTYMSVFGGGGSGTNPSADLKTGNTLRIISSGNSAATVDNFEKMEFVLDSTLNSGDTMFSAITTSGLNLEWSDISVKGAADWIAGTDGSKEVTLYSGPAIAIKNYDMANSRTTAGDFEYGLRTNVAGTGNISATQIYFNSNKFQNGDVVLDTLHPPVGVIAYGGTSTLGNTTNHNRLGIDAVQLGGSYSYNGRAYGGYTQSETGDSKYNEIIIENYARVNGAIFGGYSKKGNATNNIVTLHRTGDSSSYWNTYMDVYGGYSENNLADVRTGNLLRIIAKGNSANVLGNFEKMEYVLDGTVNSGDTMFGAISVPSTPLVKLSIDWNNITVKGLSDWPPPEQHADGQPVCGCVFLVGKLCSRTRRHRRRLRIREKGQCDFPWFGYSFCPFR